MERAARALAEVVGVRVTQARGASGAHLDHRVLVANHVRQLLILLVGNDDEASTAGHQLLDHALRDAGRGSGREGRGGGVMSRELLCPKP